MRFYTGMLRFARSVPSTDMSCTAAPNMAYRFNLQHQPALGTRGSRTTVWLAIAVLASFVPGCEAKGQDTPVSNGASNMAELRIRRRTIRVPVIEGTDIR